MSAGEPLLDAETLAYLRQLADDAPPLSQHQRDVITEAFNGAQKQQADDAP